MIILDTETTGLVQPEAVRISAQPRLIEFAALKLHGPKLIVADQLEFMCHPGCPLPTEITNITGITDKDLADRQPFAAHYEKLVEFFLGTETMVAHNLPFDRDILRYELERMGRLLKFPWPPDHKCTVELTNGIRSKRLTLSQLYEHATGKEHKDAHRAMADVEALADCVRWMRKRKLM